MTNIKNSLLRWRSEFSILQKTVYMISNSLLKERAESYGFKLRMPANAQQRGGTVSVNIPFGNAVARELLRREILVDYRPKAGIRISPHFYSTDEETAHTVDEIKNILDTKAYEPHLTADSIVT